MVAAKQASKQKWLSGGILHKIANMKKTFVAFWKSNVTLDWSE